MTAIGVDDDKAFKAIQFSGKKEDYMMWSAKFLSYAQVKGFKKVILGTEVPPKYDEDVDKDKEKQRIRKANDLAYSMLHIAVKDDVSFGAVYSATTDNLPDGDAHKAWKNLETIFKPVSNANKHDLEQKFNQCSLTKDDKNPDEWFSELEKIRLQLKLDHKEEYSDEKMISQIVYNITPNMYRTVITMLKRDLNRGITLKLSEVKDDLRQIYAQYKNSSGNNRSNRSGESMLMARKQFKGMCNNCGKLGHKAKDCWDLDKNKSKRPANYKAKESAQFLSNLNNGNNGNNNNNSANSDGKVICTWCGKENHTEDKCYRKKNGKPKKTEQANSATNNGKTPLLLCISKSQMESMLQSTDGEHSFTPDVFIADSGATSHMRYSKDGMTDLVDWKVEITVGNNETMWTEAKGTYKGTVLQQDGSSMDVVLSDVLYVPDLWVNLFSITKALTKPAVKLSNEGQLIKLNLEQNQKLVFDKVFKCGSGQLVGVDIKPTKEYASIASVKLPYDTLHAQLGHPSEAVVKATANAFGLKLENEKQACADCALGKSKIKNIPKLNTKRSTEKLERVSIDISYVNFTSFGGAKFWLLIQDEYTDFLWSKFLKSKDEVVPVMLQWIKEIQKETKLKVKTIRCDNSGENKALQESIKTDYELTTKFEFTAPNTPQQNGKIERKFATLYGKMRAMLNGAKLIPYFREKIWAQCAKLSTQLENIISKSNGEDSAHKKFYGNNPSWIKNLRTFGEIGILNDGRKIKGKLNNRGFPAMFIGYPEDHTSNVYQFINLEKQSMVLSRNVTWLNKSYGKFRELSPAEIEGELIIQELEEDVDEEEEEEIEAVDQENDPHDVIEVEDGTVTDIPKTRISGLQRELYNLDTFYNPTIERANITREVVSFHKALVANIHNGNPEPKTHFEAKQSKDWKHWWDAMCTEFKNMEEKKVWKIINKTELPTGRKLIGNRWVYVLKDDGRYRARTVAQGFSQVPGKDFHENHAPVVNDATFHLVLALKVLLKLEAGQFDIETAFLYGDLDEEIWMVIPDGYSDYVKEKHGINIDRSTHCLKLEKALYGLVQAARQWWKKFKEVMKEINYTPSPVDPCLFTKIVNGKLSFVIIYVDDGGIFSTKEDIDEVINALGKVFKVKYLGKLEHFVGCHITENHSGDKLWIHQPKLLKHLEEDFSKYITTTREYLTPAGAKTTIMRPQEDDNKISDTEQTIYRSGVGMLLYLVKHSRPDIANQVRELSKVADGATPGHWKALIRMIKYVLDTKEKRLKIEPKMDSDDLFYMEGISDSEYSGDKDTRISVYGYIIYFCGAPVSWKSKSGRSVTLSSTEAEYFALSELAKEIIFLKQLVEYMGIKIRYPIIVRVDNVGAIYIANNYTTSQRTKHIDVRTHFVREFIEDGIIKIIFIKSEDNDADIFTKNTAEELFQRHINKFMEVPYEEKSK